MKPHLPYVYRLTDKITGKRYIGSRYAKVCHPEDLGVTYFTTSARVEPLFRADPNRFEKEILLVSDRDYVIGMERKLIRAYGAVMSDEYYNRTDNRAIHPDDVLKGRARLSKEHYSALGKKGGKVAGPLVIDRLKLFASAGGKKGGVETCKPRMRCTICDLVTNRGNASRHTTASGHDEWVKL